MYIHAKMHILFDTYMQMASNKKGPHGLYHLYEKQ